MKTSSIILLIGLTCLFSQALTKKRLLETNKRSLAVYNEECCSTYSQINDCQREYAYVECTRQFAQAIAQRCKTNIPPELTAFTAGLTHCRDMRRRRMQVPP